MKTSLFGLEFYQGSLSDLVEQLKTSLLRPAQSMTKLIKIFTPNPEQIVQAKHDSRFARALAQADILLPDGVGLVWASKLLLPKSERLQARIAGTDLVKKLLQLAEAQNWQVAVVGGRGYEMSGFRRLTQAKLSWLPAYQAVQQPTAAEEAALVEGLKKLHPDLVFLAFGAPWQEQWVLQHQALLQQIGTRAVMVVGGAFDFLLGRVKRAPGWVRAVGLEWLFRLLVEPWRWKRQLRLIEFAWRVIGQAIFGVTFSLKLS